MESIIENTLSQIQIYSQELKNINKIIGHPWIEINDNDDNDDIAQKRVLIFRKKNHELLISENGNVIKGKWEFLIQNKSLLLEEGSVTNMFNQCFIDDSVIILKKDGTDNYLLLVNENKIKEKITSDILKNLEKKYNVETSNIESDEKSKFKETNYVKKFTGNNKAILKYFKYLIIAMWAAIIIFLIVFLK